jgi:hypothetical protein
MKIQPDILIEIDFDLKDPTKTIVRTNAKQEALDELFAAWVQDQIVTERSDRECYSPLEPTNDDHYLIRIGLVLDGDVFYTNHNCDNHALAVGIVHGDVWPRVRRGLGVLNLL